MTKIEQLKATLEGERFDYPGTAFEGVRLMPFECCDLTTDTALTLKWWGLTAVIPSLLWQRVYMLSDQYGMNVRLSRFAEDPTLDTRWRLEVWINASDLQKAVQP